VSIIYINQIILWRMNVKMNKDKYKDGYDESETGY